MYFMMKKSLDFKFLRQLKGGRNTEDGGGDGMWDLMERDKKSFCCLLILFYFESKCTGEKV